MTQKRFKIGKIFQPYLLVDNLFTYFEKQDKFYYLWNSSNSSRVYLIKYFKLLRKRTAKKRATTFDLISQDQALNFLINKDNFTGKLHLESNSLLQLNTLLPIICTSSQKIHKLTFVASFREEICNEKYLDAFLSILNEMNLKSLSIVSFEHKQYFSFFNFMMIQKIQKLEVPETMNYMLFDVIQNFQNLRKLTVVLSSMHCLEYLWKLPTTLKNLYIKNIFHQPFKEELFQTLAIYQFDQLSFQQIINLNEFIEYCIQYKIYPKKLFVKILHLDHYNHDFSLLNTYFQNVELVTGKQGQVITLRIQLLSYQKSELQHFLSKIRQIELILNDLDKNLNSYSQESFDDMVKNVEMNSKLEKVVIKYETDNFLDNMQPFAMVLAMYIMAISPNLQSIQFENITSGNDELELKTFKGEKLTELIISHGSNQIIDFIINHQSSFLNIERLLIQDYITSIALIKVLYLPFKQIKRLDIINITPVASENDEYKQLLSTLAELSELQSLSISTRIMVTEQLALRFLTKILPTFKRLITLKLKMNESYDQEEKLYKVIWQDIFIEQFSKALQNDLPIIRNLYFLDTKCHYLFFVDILCNVQRRLKVNIQTTILLDDFLDIKQQLPQHFLKFKGLQFKQDYISRSQQAYLESHPEINQYIRGFCK